jgi:hypothetical protein
MTIEESVTIEYRDDISNDDACIIVRQNPNGVTICLSLKSNGDVETSMSRQTARDLIAAIERTID